MYLYELALETGERSADLALRAQSLGLAGASPSTMLTGPQAMALRSGLPLPPSAGPGSEAGPRLEPGAPSDPAPGSAPVSFTAPPEFGGLPPAPAGPPRSSLAPPPGLGGPGAPPGSAGGPSARRRPSTTQLAVAGVVAVVLVMVAALMVSQSNDNAARRRNLAAENAKADARTEAEAAKEADALDRPSAQPSSGSTPVVETPADPGSEITQLGTFCRSIRTAQILEIRLAADNLDGDWKAARATIAKGRAGWQQGVDAAIASTSGTLQSDLQFYRTTYMVLLDRVAASTTTSDVQTAYRAVPVNHMQDVAKHLNDAAFTCR